MHSSRPPTSSVPPGSTIFQDREESEFYAQCVRDFLFRRGYESLENKEVVELGVGSGESIVDLIRRHEFHGKIRGFEIHWDSYQGARRLTEESGVSDRYIVTNADFFGAVRELEFGGCAISNPPYLPAEDDQILMPELWGGRDGSEVTRRILDCDFERVVMLISSFSNPLFTIDYATRRGYRVVDYVVRTMHFGIYSSEPKVMKRIDQLRDAGLAFVSKDRYCLAGVAWVRSPVGHDLATPLKQAVTTIAARP